MPAKLRVAEIPASDHLEFLRGRSSASFLQTPAWATVKSEWRSESLGWFEGDRLVGAGLVLFRQLPKLKRYLAYLPEGPVLDWDTDDLAAWLTPMTEHLKGRGAFAVRMGPPVVLRRWDAAAVKAGIADDSVRRLGNTQEQGYLVEAQRMLAEALVQAGKLGQAERIAEHARRAVGQDDVWSRASTLHALGVVKAAQGCREDACKLLREALAIVEPTMYKLFTDEVRRSLDTIAGGATAAA